MKKQRRRPPSSPAPPRARTPSPGRNSRNPHAAPSPRNASNAAKSNFPVTPTPRKRQRAAMFASHRRTPRSTRRQLHLDLASTGPSTPTSAARAGRGAAGSGAKRSGRGGGGAKGGGGSKERDADGVDKLLRDVRDLMRSTDVDKPKGAEQLMDALRRADEQFQHDISDASSASPSHSDVERETHAQDPAQERPAAKKMSVAALRSRLQDVNKKKAEGKRGDDVGEARSGSDPRCSEQDANPLGKEVADAPTPQESKRLRQLRRRLSKNKVRAVATSSDGVDDGDDGSDIDTTMRTHRRDIEALKKDDPEFYKFLEENDSALLDVDDLALEDNDDSDIEDEDANESDDEIRVDVPEDAFAKSTAESSDGESEDDDDEVDPASDLPRTPEVKEGNSYRDVALNDGPSHTGGEASKKDSLQKRPKTPKKQSGSVISDGSVHGDVLARKDSLKKRPKTPKKQNGPPITGDSFHGGDVPGKDLPKNRAKTPKKQSGSVPELLDGSSSTPLHAPKSSAVVDKGNEKGDDVVVVEDDSDSNSEVIVVGDGKPSHLANGRDSYSSEKEQINASRDSKASATNSDASDSVEGDGNIVMEESSSSSSLTAHDGEIEKGKGESAENSSESSDGEEDSDESEGSTDARKSRLPSTEVEKPAFSSPRADPVASDNLNDSESSEDDEDTGEIVSDGAGDEAVEENAKEEHKETIGTEAKEPVHDEDASDTSESDEEEALATKPEKPSRGVSPVHVATVEGSDSESDGSDSDDQKMNVGTSKSKQISDGLPGTDETNSESDSEVSNDSGEGAAQNDPHNKLSEAGPSLEEVNGKIDGMVDDKTGYSSDEDDSDEEMAEAAAAAEAGIAVNGEDSESSGDEDDTDVEGTEEVSKGKVQKDNNEDDDEDDEGQASPAYTVDMKYIQHLKGVLDSERAGVKICKDLLRIFRAGRGVIPNSRKKKPQGENEDGEEDEHEEHINPNDAKEEEDASLSTGNVKFMSSTAYQQAMNLAITGFQDIVDRATEKPSGKNVSEASLAKWNPRENNRWPVYGHLVKMFTMHMVGLANTVEDAPTLRFLLKRLERVAPYTIDDERMAKSILRVAIRVWSSSGHHVSEETRLRSYLLLSRLAHVDGNTESVLRACFNAYHGNIASACNAKTLGRIEFAVACLVELFGIDVGSSYTVVFSHLREMAVTLRSVIVSKEGKEEVERVHNWAYVNQLRLFGRVLSRYGREDELGPLIYPYVQIALGLMRVHPTPRTIPLRLHVASYLTEVMRETGTYIPVAPHLLTMLRVSELRKKPTHGAVKAMEWRGVLRVADDVVRTRTFLSGVVDGVVLETARYFGAMAGHVSFPEVAWVTEVGLRKAGKEMGVGEWKERLVGVAGALRKTAEVVMEARRVAGAVPRDVVGGLGMKAVVEGVVVRKLMIVRLLEVELRRAEKERKLRDTEEDGKEDAGKEKAEGKRKGKRGAVEEEGVEGDGNGKRAVKRAKIGKDGEAVGKGKGKRKEKGTELQGSTALGRSIAEEEDQVGILHLDSDSDDSA